MPHKPAYSLLRMQPTSLPRQFHYMSSEQGIGPLATSKAAECSAKCAANNAARPSRNGALELPRVTRRSVLAVNKVFRFSCVVKVRGVSFKHRKIRYDTNGEW